jgi:DNA-binding response OmpR family regulator
MARILVAEDNPTVCSFLEKGLRASGFATLVAEDGEQAEQLSLTQEFDLMILDMGLPKRDGLHVLQEIRARGRKLPVLVLTGRTERDIVTCLEGGADDYISKPFKFDELLARVRARLRPVASHEPHVLAAPPPRPGPESGAAALAGVGLRVRSRYQRRQGLRQLAAQEARRRRHRDRSRRGLPPPHPVRKSFPATDGRLTGHADVGCMATSDRSSRAPLPPARRLS